MTIEFFLPMVPPTMTHQEKQIKIVKGKPIVYEPAELKAVRTKLMAHLGQHVPEEKYTEAVRLTTKWLFPSGKHKNGTYKTTKPDTDNLVKMLKDVMTDLKYWTDDSLVASEITEKFWADKPGIYIRIEELE
jgi:Holliday junction resolvase RusA-like endonuclease